MASSRQYPGNQVRSRYRVNPSTHPRKGLDSFTLKKNMNKLLSNYLDSRSAILDHCGVTGEYGRSFPIETLNYPWSISSDGYLITQINKSGSVRTEVVVDKTDPASPKVAYRGDSITLVLRYESDFEPNLNWLALDNDLEVK